MFILNFLSPTVIEPEITKCYYLDLEIKIETISLRFFEPKKSNERSDLILKRQLRVFDYFICR